MMLRRAAAGVLLACALAGLAAPMPAQAAFFSRPNASTPVQTATLQPPTGVNVAFNCVANGNITVTWTASSTATTIGSRAANGGYTVAVTKSLLGFLPTTTNYTVANLGSVGAVVTNASLLSSLKVEVWATYPASWTSSTVLKTVC
jgi:hypothetical protein